jgi:DNA-directed RNA polymerase specialized sigma24 family protein
LNPEDFQRLLARLDCDPVVASVKYAQLRDRLIRYCSSRGEHLSAEDLADDAIDEVARKPDLESIHHIQQFSIGVLRFKLLAHRRKHPQRAAEDVDSLTGEPDLERSIIDGLDQERKQHCFYACMERFTPSERRLILEYYPNERANMRGRRKRLAALIGIHPGTLVTRVNRLRGKLVNCCMDCYRRSAKKEDKKGM